MKKIFIILAITFFACGCATVPKKETVTLFKEALYSIDGASYVPASVIIQNYGTDYSWDLVTRKLEIEKRGIKAYFCVGADAAVVNNKPYKMSAATKLYLGKIMIPASFMPYLDEVFAGKRIPAAIEGIKYAMRTVVVDAGHGGKDPGTMSPRGIKEKTINLNIAKQLGAYLRDEGINVVLTRDRDNFISLSRRVQIANEKNADFFISIHVNAARHKSVNGVEVFYLSDAVDDFARVTAASENAALQYEKSSFCALKPKEAVAATLWDMLCTENRAESTDLAECVSQEICRALSTKNRGVKAAKFYVLKGAQMPAVLVEVGFLSNKEEAVKLNNIRYQQSLARAIADGILTYKRRYEKTDGFTR